MLSMYSFVHPLSCVLRLPRRPRPATASSGGVSTSTRVDHRARLRVLELEVVLLLRDPILPHGAKAWPSKPLASPPKHVLGVTAADWGWRCEWPLMPASEGLARLEVRVQDMVLRTASAPVRSTVEFSMKKCSVWEAMLADPRPLMGKNSAQARDDYNNTACDGVCTTYSIRLYAILTTFPHLSRLVYAPSAGVSPSDKSTGGAHLQPITWIQFFTGSG